MGILVAIGVNAAWLAVMVAVKRSQRAHPVSRQMWVKEGNLIELQRRG